MPRSHSPKFRCKVVDLVASGCLIKQVTGMFGIGNLPIYNRHRLPGYDVRPRLH
jgi:hypothetical protein